MNLKYATPLIPLQMAMQMGGERVKAMAWSPNGQKLAVCRSDRVIQLFDEKGGPRDKFATRGAELKATSSPQAYSVTSLAFSPDSIFLAVGQSDCIIFIYKIGEDFKMKKSITNKFSHTAAVTTMVWPNEMEMICGLSDGKIRHANMMGKGQKAKTAYNVTDGYVVNVVANGAGTELAASFTDGQIVVFTIGNPEQMVLKYKVRHSVPATALALSQDSVLAGGSDMKIIVYDKTGKSRQQFDYSKDPSTCDFTCAGATVTGQAVVFGAINKLKIFHYQSRKKVWEEGKTKTIENLYVPTAMQWKRDGTLLVVATSVGTFHLFEAAYRKSKNDKIELSFISPSNVIMKVVESGKKMNIKSKYGSEISDVQLMGRDSFAIGKTSETIIICDLEHQISSEIPWADVEERERFYFENQTVCMIFNGGEMTLVEYGKDEILGSFRTEWINPHVISVRVNERLSKRDIESGVTNKKLAYLLDLKSITVVDLEYNLPLAEIQHDSKVDWLELNETGSKLLYRDRRTRLVLVDVGTMSKHTLDQTCGFVSWVPGSDVVVAQSKKTLRIWYNLDTPEISVDLDIRGVATEIVKDKGKTVVILRDGSVTQEIELDQSRIEFTTAIEDGDLARATQFLESCEQSSEVAGMWAKLAKVAVEAQELKIAQKAYAAVGDVPRAKFLQTTIDLAKAEQGINPNERGFWKQSYEVQARLHLMGGRIKEAEAIYLSHGDVDRAIKMYETLQKWDEAITLAKVKSHPGLTQMMDQFLDRLVSSGQYDVAAEFLEKHGEPQKSIALYLEGGFPTRAARIVMKNRALQNDRDLTSQVCESLLQGEFLEETGDLYDFVAQKSRALECYRRGYFYEKAIKLAKSSFPNEVVSLYEELGDYQVSCRQMEAASNNYIEAGCLIKGLDAALESRQWKKALHIIEAIDDASAVSKQWIRIGEHFNSIDELAQAERCFMKGNNPKRAVEMYTEKDRWEDAHRIATQSTGISKQELQRQYIDQAKAMQESGRYMQAEKLYVAIGEVDMAIKMYATNKMYDNVLSLIQTHRSEHLGQTLKHLAEICIQEDNFKAAESHFIRAGLWSDCVEMYVSRGLWEDAYRVARNHGGVQASKSVIFKWAAALTPDTAVKLLTKFGYIYDCIDHLCQKGSFMVAEEIAQLGARDKLMEIQVQWAQYCEEKREYEDARSHYVQANMAKDAVDMYLKVHNLPKAIETAERYAPEELQRVLLKHAEQLFENKEFNNFEAIVIRAEKPEIAVELYKRHNMWAEAFRVCKQYAPHLTSQLQEDYSAFDSRSDASRQPEELIEQAKEFERQGEYRKAIERYLQLTPQLMDNDIVLAKCWTRAADLASKFLLKEHADFVLKSLAPMLSSIGRYPEAASLYVQSGQYKEAVRALIEGDLWEDARRLAAELGPKMEEYVKMKQTESLKASGQIEQLEGVNVHAALELLCEQGQWNKCLDRAKSNPETLSKYMAKYVTHLIKGKTPRDALKVYMDYGTPCNKEHFHLYRALAILFLTDISVGDFDTWSELRNVMHSVINGLNSSGADHRSNVYQQMDHFLWIAHFYTNKAAFQNCESLEPLAAKAAVSLLRYSGVVPVERAFYEAGVLCRKVKWNNMAFVFLNHYLDIRDAIEEGTKSTGGLDNSDFMNTDIPTDCDLPDEGMIPEESHNEVKEWVLSASMDNNIQQVLREDDRNIFEGSLVSDAGDERWDPCVLTGYPVTGPKVSFRTTSRFSNKEDWNRFIAVSRSEPNEQLANIGTFISSWCGSSPNYSL